MLQTWLEIVEKIVSHCCFVKNRRQEEEPGQDRDRKRKTWIQGHLLALMGASWYFQFVNDEQPQFPGEVGLQDRVC